MEALIDLPEVGVLWFTSPADKETFADVTLRASEAIIADPVQAADDFVWYRTSWSELQSRKDGLTLDASGVSPLLPLAGKLLPVSREQSDCGWLTAIRDTQLPTAAAFGMLVVHDTRDNAQRLQAGRIWQRLHLWATAQGLAMQPLNQVVERAEWEQTANFAPEFTRAVAAMIPNPWHAIIPFRIGSDVRSPAQPAASGAGSRGAVRRLIWHGVYAGSGAVAQSRTGRPLCGIPRTSHTIVELRDFGSSGFLKW